MAKACRNAVSKGGGKREKKNWMLGKKRGGSFGFPRPKHALSAPEKKKGQKNKKKKEKPADSRLVGPNKRKGRRCPFWKKGKKGETETG